MALLPVKEALERVLKGSQRLGVETVSLSAALHRVLAEDVTSLRTQPPFDLSAMDGYALRAADGSAGATLTIIGESAAGHRFGGRVGDAQTVRIFTGAPIPDGADAVVIQENTKRDRTMLTLTEATKPGGNIRRRGLDFAEGAPVLKSGIRLAARDLALAAATNHASLRVARRPRVGILATGDEIVAPGSPIGPDQIVASNSFALHAMAAREGAEVIDLGIAGDSFAELEKAIRRARDGRLDVLVTIGGASVGDHDLVQTALTREGMELGFWKIAMRPGKPLMHGSLGSMKILGMPGNPVSAIVCGILFLTPLLRALQGQIGVELPRATARFAVDWPANDQREDYLRAQRNAAGDVTPFAMQDSSMVSVLAAADCLVIRPAHAPSALAGDACSIIDLVAAGY